MAASQRFTGKELVVHFIHSGGTADISGEYRTLSIERSANVVDLTAGSDDWAYEKVTTKTISATLSALYTGTAGASTYGSVTLGAEGTLNYYPNGTASGQPKGGFPCVVKKASPDFSYDDEVSVSYEFGPQGDELSDPLSDTA